ncbi:MAG: hypothetical protein ACTSQE_04755 [Candidatus Heimdallarchaeaceae archaeon]
MIIEKNWSKIFPLFYEKLIRKWLITEKGWNEHSIQPRIYYRKQTQKEKEEDFEYIDEVIDKFNKRIVEAQEDYEKTKDSKKVIDRYFCADGFYTDRNGKKILIEAKSWVYPHTTDGRLVNNPDALYFALSDKISVGQKNYKIDKFLLIFWSGEADAREEGLNGHRKGKKIHEHIVDELKKCRPKNEFEIIYLLELFNDWREKQPIWYTDAIDNIKNEIYRMFDWLTSKNN